MEIGNQMQTHKIQTNSELIYEDGSIWSTLIFIKIIGSDTLWFPLPPSEVLFSLETNILALDKTPDLHLKGEKLLLFHRDGSFDNPKKYFEYQTSFLEGGPLMWMMPLHINQKSDYGDDETHYVRAGG